MWSTEEAKRGARCVLVYSPEPCQVVFAMRRRGIDARQCFELSEIVDHLVDNTVCAVALPQTADAESNAYAAQALARRHPEVTLVTIGREVEGVPLHLSWPLPEDAVFLQWLEVEGAPLGVNDEETERLPFDLAPSSGVFRRTRASILVEDEVEHTLPEDELDTLVDTVRTELLDTARV
jgi:hypothetical protein